MHEFSLPECPSKEMQMPDLSVEAAGRPRGSVGSATDDVVRDTALELGPE